MGNTLANVLFDSGSAELPPHQAAATRKSLAEIKVLSFNIFIRPPMINNNGDDYKDERIEEFFKVAHKYDVICLQEMFSAYSTRRTLFIERARKAGFNHFAAAPKPAILSKHFIDAGLIVLSRYPIEASEFCTLPPGHGVDYFVQKGILYAKIKVGDAALHVYNTHGQANYDPNPMKAFLIRSDQHITFQKFIRSTLSKHIYSEEDLVLLMGDYNVDSKSKHKFQSQDLSDVPGLKGLGFLAKMKTFGEYDALLSLLSNNDEDEIEDLLLKDLGEHPVTFGESVRINDKESLPLEKILTTKHDLCTNQSLDYMFKFVPKNLEYEPFTPDRVKPRSKDRLAVVAGSARVEKFLVAGHIFDQLSDHYGVQVTVKLTKRGGLDSQDTDSTTSSPTKPMFRSP